MHLCKYCGKEVRPSGSQGLFASGTGWTCVNSPSKKHVLSANSELVCRYCGKAVKNSGTAGLFASGAGYKCLNSPNQKHCLS